MYGFCLANSLSYTAQGGRRGYDMSSKSSSTYTYPVAYWVPTMAGTGGHSIRTLSRKAWMSPPRGNQCPRCTVQVRHTCDDKQPQTGRWGGKSKVRFRTVHVLSLKCPQEPAGWATCRPLRSPLECTEPRQQGVGVGVAVGLAWKHWRKWKWKRQWRTAG